MTGGRVSTVNDKISVKHRSNQLDGSVIELPVPDCAQTASSGKGKCTLESQNSDKLTPRDLVSAVGYAWNLANRPLSIQFSGKNSTLRSDCGDGDSVVYYSTDEPTFQVSASPDYSSAVEISSRKVHENHQSSAVSQYICARGPPAKLRNIYGWMSRVSVPRQMSLVNLVHLERRKGDIYRACGSLPNSCCGFPFAESIVTLNGISPFRADSAQASSELVSCRTPEKTALGNSVSIVADCLIVTSTSDDEDGIGYNAKSLRDKEKNDQKTNSEPDFYESEIISVKVKEEFGKPEHAVAGAMAGIFVSLCLHPIDTVKTVIQSCRADVKPLRSIIRTIISEKGFSGLYRGVSSNILCSAPISALYTFTYETVKKGMLPLFPKECCSLAHCTAGGCASIATSFIFTPSERIKQQMQVGTSYRNCWNALIQIIKKGGLPSLYTGWGAVLCRNIPHSIIKFYTYENLKQIISSYKSDPLNNTVVTLICGGLAGSTASLFTTPFDVVKTRLQTQIPGSVTQCSGVFTTLTDIRKREGLKGLYRGLTPRLVMYMIQGALFFTSYESFKRLLSLELTHSS